MVDYSEDFLEKLVAINFGAGQWMAIQAAIPTITGTVSIDATFPDQSGGTPGFPFWVASVAATYPSGPRQITAALLHSTLRTQAGAAMTGFGERVAISGRNFVRLWIKLDQLMPKSTFRVRMNSIFTGGLGGGASIQVSTVAKNTMKSGRRTSVIGFGSFAEVHPNSSAGTPRDFRVNPATLEVTPPPP